MSPFDPRPLLDRTDEGLEELLAALDPDDWALPAVGEWTVKDVVAHLIDTGLRRLSIERDGFVPPGPTDGEALVAFLDRLNAEWVTAARRLSPQVLTELIRSCNTQSYLHFAALDLDAEATFPVAWAGEERSTVRFDLARELTERWHHQQQIRDAVGRPGLTGGEILLPVLDTLLQALRRSYAACEAAYETEILISTKGEGSVRASWVLRRTETGWNVDRVGSHAGRPGSAPPTEAAATIRLDADTLWRFLMKGVSAEEARGRATLEGPSELVDPFFRARGVMG